MATIYWSGAIDTDIDDYRNYVTGENADPSSATIADNSGDFSGDNVIFQSLAVSNVSNNPTVNANETFNSIRIDSGSTLTGNASFSITVDGEADGAGTTTSGYAVDIDGALGTNVNLIITTADTTNLDIIPSSGNVHDLTINLGDAARIAKIQTGGPTLTGDLTITSGQLSTENNALTVTGDASVTGTLTGGTSAISLGSLTINSGGTYSATSGTTTITSRTSGGYSWYSPTTGSTFNHNNGLVKLTYTTNETFWQGTGFYDLEIAGNSAHEHRYDDLTDGSGLTIFNNFTITEGRVRFNQAGDSVTVHGLTKMVSGQYGNTGTAPSGTHNYGNVVIEGGTWKVTSGTCNMSGIRKLGGTLA